MDVGFPTVARYASQLSNKSANSQDIVIADRRNAIHALLVAVGHKADTCEAVEAIVETGGQRHSLRAVIGRVMSHMSGGALAELVRAFRRLFALEERRLSWVSLYEILVDFVVKADIKSYLAVGSQRLKSAVAGLSDAEPVFVERPRSYRPLAELELCAQ